MDGGDPVAGASFVVALAAVAPPEVGPVPTGDSLPGGTLPLLDGPEVGTSTVPAPVVMRVTTDGTGSAVLPALGAWNLRIEGDEFRRLGRDVPIAAEGTTEVWVYRRAVVRGAVLLRGGPIPTGMAAEVVGYPTAESPKGWGSRAEDIGSARWIETRFGGKRRTLWRAPVLNGRYEIEVPAVEQFTLVASAPRHASDLRSLDLRPTAGASLEGVDLVLRESPAWKVHVTDENGQPIKNARVTRFNRRQVPNSQSKLENENLLAAAGGGGASVWSCDQTGLTTIVHSTREATGASGDVQIADRSGQVATTQILMVAAEGFRAIVATEEIPGEYSEKTVVLHRISDADGFYRMTWHGAPLTGEATVNVLEAIDEAVSRGRPGPAMVVRDGRVPRNAFEIGREYYLMMHGVECGARSGRVTISGSDNIEISGLENF